MPASTLRLYALDKHEPVLCDSFLTFDLFLANFDARRVAHDTVGDVHVSSVFIGISTDNRPRLFETMVFGGPHHRYCVRAETWDECLRNHAQALRMIGAGDGAST